SPKPLARIPLLRALVAVLASPPQLIMAKLLNHTDRKFTALYDLHRYDQEKRDAMNLWSKTCMNFRSCRLRDHLDPGGLRQCQSLQKSDKARSPVANPKRLPG
ncbi:hypothetical protein JKG47_07155, partial [Acidithiobacillus sp. MC6.1]|nr:hypothetical protein [Acidithiobacillus sp. MC6.1]